MILDQLFEDDKKKKLNEIDPHNFDSDEDYYAAVRRKRKPSYDDDYDDYNDEPIDSDDESYYEKYVRTKNLEGAAEGNNRQGMIGFHLDSERAYEAVMGRYGNMIDQDEDSGTMYAPERIWPKIEMVAYDADGIGAIRDDAEENPEHYGVTEAGPRAVDAQGNPIVKPTSHSYSPSDDSQTHQMQPGDSYGTSKGLVTKTNTGIVHKARSSMTPKPNPVEETGQQKGADYRNPPEADYGPDYQDMVARVKKLAGLGPLKTVYDPQKRVYKNVPTAVQAKK